MAVTPRAERSDLAFAAPEEAKGWTAGQASPISIPQGPAGEAQEDVFQGRAAADGLGHFCGRDRRKKRGDLVTVGDDTVREPFVRDSPCLHAGDERFQARRP